METPVPQTSSNEALSTGASMGPPSVAYASGGEALGEQTTPRGEPMQLSEEGPFLGDEMLPEAAVIATGDLGTPPFELAYDMGPLLPSPVPGPTAAAHGGRPLCARSCG